MMVEHRASSRLNGFRSAAIGLVAVLAAAGGCAQRPELVPSNDPSLRKTSTEFAADAAKRFPYKADAPHAGAVEARAEVGYMLHRIELMNQSPESWDDVEVWINRAYVVHIPHLDKGVDRSLPFQMFFDDSGHYFPTSGTLIKQFELYRDGKFYDIKTQTAD
jgi:hypothetical protein